MLRLTTVGAITSLAKVCEHWSVTKHLYTLIHTLTQCPSIQLVSGYAELCYGSLFFLSFSHTWAHTRTRTQTPTQYRARVDATWHMCIQCVCMCVCARARVHIYTPVSYTHLDVYKRQL